MSRYFTACMQLIRLDKPEAIALLYLPCLWALIVFAQNAFDFWRYAVIFLFGAFFTRSAGCIINDMADIELDKTAERTKHRPLASGALSKKQAALALCFPVAGAVLLLPFLPPAAMVIACVAAMLTCVYPLTKRCFALPQLVLAVTFNTGVLMAGAIAAEYPFKQALALYIAAALWTFAYDTLYAMPDREADASAGMKSSPLTLGRFVHPVALACYALMFVLLFAVLPVSESLWFRAAAVACIGVLAAYYAYEPSRPYFFRGNVIVGILVAIAFFAATR